MDVNGRNSSREVKENLLRCTDCGLVRRVSVFGIGPLYDWGIRRQAQLLVHSESDVGEENYTPCDSSRGKLVCSPGFAFLHKLVDRST